MPKLGIYGDEVVSRCPSCGDSDSPKNGHLYINLKTGRFYCQKCGFAGTKEKMKWELDQLTKNLLSDNSLVEHNYQIESGAGSPRLSLLERFHWKSSHNEIWDAFKIYNKHQKQVGIHLRGTHKRSKTVGERGISYPRTIDLTKPVVLVEGPYDVVDSQYICCFGLPYKKLLQHHNNLSVILMPDGDVYIKPVLRNRLITLLETVLSGYWSGAFIDGLNFIKNGKDPDEITDYYSEVVEIRGQTPLRQFVNQLRRVNNES